MSCTTTNNTACNITNTENAPCSPCDSGCPITLNDACIIYTGDNVSSLGLHTNDKLDTVLDAILGRITGSVGTVSFNSLSLDTTQFTDAVAPEQNAQYTKSADNWVNVRGRLVNNVQINSHATAFVTLSPLPVAVRPARNQKIGKISSDGTPYELQVLTTGDVKVYAANGNILVATSIDLNFSYNVN